MLESEIERQKICESDTVRERERARETFRGKMKTMNGGNVAEKYWRRPSQLVCVYKVRQRGDFAL